MALQPQIASLKSSGTYRFEFDKSQTISIPAEQIRLLVGFSKKGPFNTPIYVSDSDYFQEVFGEIDRGLERKGTYFHRSCLAALERGPILALNLLRVDSVGDDADVVDDISYSTSATSPNTAKAEDLYAGFFNRNVFWYPDPDAFLSNITVTGNKLFNLVNINGKPISIIVRKADPTYLKGFDITVKEWYGVSNIPDYLHKDDYISDFMVDVIVIQGNWGPSTTDTYPYERFSSDPMFADYFDRTQGAVRKLSVADTQDTSLEQFLNLPEVTHVATYTGSLIPDFIDLNKNNMFIQDLINADTAKTGLFCAVNKAAYDTGELLSAVDGGLDLIGHNLEYEQPTSIDFLSYKETIKSDLEYAKNASTINTISMGTVAVTDTSAGTVMFSSTLSADPTFYSMVVSAAFRANDPTTSTTGSYILKDGGAAFAPVITVQYTSTTAYFEVSGTGVTASDFTTNINYLNYTDLDYLVDDTEGAAASTFMGGVSSTIYSNGYNGIITDGDRIVWDADGSGDPQVAEVGYLDINITTDTSIVYDTGAAYADIAITDSTYPVPVANITAYSLPEFTVGSEIAFDFTQVFFDSTDTAGSADTFIAQTLKGALNQSIPATATTDSNIITVESAYAEDLQVGYYLLQDAGSSTTPSRLTRITRISADVSGTLTITTVGKILIRTIASIATVEVYVPVADWTDYYTIKSLDGFTHGAYHLPDGTMEQQNNIINDTLSGTNLFNALVDTDNIAFRYLVDTFGLGIEAQSKYLFSYLAKTRGNAMAILNAPSVKDFKESTDPYFLDLQGGVSSKMISEGGDLTLNPTVLYSLPSIPNGSTYAAYYGPYIAVRDRGKNVMIPPAAYVSNNYVDKYVNALPWSIIAGARRGVLGGRGVVGLEHNFSRNDRDWLEPFGYNPIIFQSGTGIVIMANKTAQQNIKSALSSAHVREVLIYIEDGIAAILKNFIFEFNTPQIRLEIKTLSDNFMDKVMADSGVYNYRNIMDETNNTPEVIDQNIGILDTYVEPVKGLEILVHRTTILKTGQIATGEYL